MRLLSVDRLGRMPAWLDPVLIGILVAAIYAQGIRHDFITFDDSLYITGNARVLDGLSWSSFLWAWSNFDAANYHPLTWLSYLLDIGLFGLRPGWMVIENAALHAINGWLVARLLSALGVSRGAALLAAMVFIAHPVNVESVAWISQRKTMLAALFGMAALLVYVLRARRGMAPANWQVMVLLTASLLSKAWFVVAPALLLVLDIWSLQRVASAGSASAEGTTIHRLWLILREKAPMAALVAGVSIATIFSQGSQDAIATTAVVPVSLRIQNATVSILAYLSDTVRLGGFSIFYPLPDSIPAAAFFASVGAVATISIGVIMIHRGHGPLVAGWFWFLLFLLPVIGLIQVGGQARADRYMYLPLVGLLWAMAHLGERAWQTLRPFTRQVVPLAALAWITILGMVAHWQVHLWQNTFGIAGHSIAISGANPRLLALLGAAHMQAGRWDAAIPLLERSLKEDNANSAVALNLALAYAETGRTTAAIQLTEQVAAAEPANYGAHRNLALFYREIGDEAKAVEMERRLNQLEQRPGAHFTGPSTINHP